jgi:hypothetical protein
LGRSRSLSSSSSSSSSSSDGGGEELGGDEGGGVGTAWEGPGRECEGVKGRIGLKIWFWGNDWVCLSMIIRY